MLVKAGGKLEVAGAAVEPVMMERNAVIEPQRANRQVHPHTDAPVVAIIVDVKLIRLRSYCADVVEESEPQAFDDGNTVFRGGEPGGIAADRLGEARLSRADAAIFETAQGIQPAEIKA